MDLVSFHRNWFGKDPIRTPSSFLVRPEQIELYEAWPKARGLSNKEKDPSIFVATLVLALLQTRPKSSGKVLLITPPTHRQWVLEQMKSVVRYMVRCRKNNPNGIATVKDVASQIYLYHTPSQIFTEPAKWVSFGFDSLDADVPSWMSNALLTNSEKA